MRRGQQVKTVLAITLVLIALLCGCNTCRVTSVEDAITYTTRGYDTRIEVYKTGMDGKIWGADSPTFSVANGEIHYREVTDYVLSLKRNKVYF